MANLLAKMATTGLTKQNSPEGCSYEGYVIMCVYIEYPVLPLQKDFWYNCYSYLPLNKYNILRFTKIKLN